MSLNTEPIGFKGTPRDWIVNGYGNMICTEPTKDGKNTGNIVCLAPEEWTSSMVRWDENAQLISASKRMAIALQTILNDLKDTDFCHHHHVSFDFAVSVLKEAGLNP